jgi:hypothetical protein
MAGKDRIWIKRTNRNINLRGTLKGYSPTLLTMRADNAQEDIRMESTDGTIWIDDMGLTWRVVNLARDVR